MNPKLVETLERRAPRLFRGNPSLECGDGWAGLLKELFDSLERTCEHMDEADVEPIALLSAAAHFGALRIELAYLPPNVLPLVRTAEARSRSVCERCGMPGRIRGHACHLQALCDAHAPIPAMPRPTHRPSLSR